jgi:hypothetical protein
MVSQKGHNKGHPNYNVNGDGRPRTYDRELMAQDLLDWVENEDSIDIKQWRIKHKITRDKVMDMRNQSENFNDAYAYAFDVLAQRRWEMNHTDELKDSLYGLHARVYDRDLDEQKKSEKKYEIDAKYAASAANNTNEATRVIIIDARSNSPTQVQVPSLPG